MSYLYIDREECIGDSLGKINYNADNFDSRITTISSTFIQQVTSTSPQIVTNTQNGVVTLTAVPFYKASVTFRGKGISNFSPCTIYSSYNVSEVIKVQEALYQIRFITPIVTTGFSHGCIIEQSTDGTTVFGADSFNPSGSAVSTWSTSTPLTSVYVFSLNTGLPPAFTSYKDVARATLNFY